MVLLYFFNLDRLKIGDEMEITLNNKYIKELINFENKIIYTFKNKDNLILALTHSSYANENRHSRYNYTSNERLEFLGDAVLNIVISDRIYTKCKNMTEGDMTKARAAIVCEASLVTCANAIEISKYLLLGKGEELTGGRHRPSILADAFEALIGAIYIDGGIRSARKFINNNINQIFEDAVKGYNYKDHKTHLQEVVQSKGDGRISYDLLEEKGPDHDKTFITRVNIDDETMGVGEGKTKKESEQNAAMLALKKLGVI